MFQMWRQTKFAQDGQQPCLIYDEQFFFFFQIEHNKGKLNSSYGILGFWMFVGHIIMPPSQVLMKPKLKSDQ